MSEEESSGQSARGSYIAQADRGGTASVNITNIQLPAAPRIPLQRPARAEHFTDRERELAKLLDDLQPGGVVTLTGPGGIGKTALAAEAIWTLAPEDDPPERFPDGILFHSFYNQSQTDLALEKIALAYGEEPRPTPKDAAQRALAGRRALLVLDGAEDADDLPSILEIRDRCCALITSRTRRDIVESGQAIGSLPIPQAIRLLKKWGGRRAKDDVAARRICELVGGLPLAIRIVGRYLVESEEEAADYLAWLEETPLAALDQGKRQHESLPVLLEASVSKLTQNARLALGVIGLLALAPFPREFAAEALARPSPEVGRILGELVSYGLLLKEKKHYLVSHPLLHTYARQMPVPEGAIELLGEYFVRFAQARTNLALPDVQEMEIAWPHIQAALTHLVEGQVWEPVAELGHILTRSGGEGYLQRSGYWQAEQIFLENGITACGELIRALPGDADRWSLQRADLEYGLGDLWFSKDQYDQAITALDESLHHYEEIQHREREIARTKLRLGEIRLNRGDFDQAVECFEDSLRIYQQIEAGAMEFASTHLWLGRSYHRKGAYDRAQAQYEKSLTAYRREGDLAESAYILIQLGALAFDKSEPSKGQDYFGQAEELLEAASGDLQRIAKVRVDLANQYRWNRMFARATALHQQSIRDFESLGDKPNAAWSMQALADTYFEQGDRRHAEEIYHEVVQRFEELGIAHGKAYACDHLGMIRLEQGKVDEARAYFEQALEIFRASQLKSGIAYVLFNLADTERAAGGLDGARKHYQASLDIWQALSNTERIKLTQERLEALPMEPVDMAGDHSDDKA